MPLCRHRCNKYTTLTGNYRTYRRMWIRGYRCRGWRTFFHGRTSQRSGYGVRGSRALCDGIARSTLSSSERLGLNPNAGQKWKFHSRSNGILVNEPRRRRTPIYSRLKHQRSQRGIMLTPLPETTGPQGVRLEADSSSSLKLYQSLSQVTKASMAGSADSAWPTATRLWLRVSLELVDDLTNGISQPDTESWMEWIRSVPADAQAIHVGVKRLNNLDDCDSASDSISDAVELIKICHENSGPTIVQEFPPRFRCWADRIQVSRAPYHNVLK